MMIDFKPDMTCLNKVIGEPCKTIEFIPNPNNGSNEAQQVDFDSTVHFNGQIGFHLLDQDGKNALPINDVIQNLIVQTIMQLNAGQRRDNNQN